MQAGCAAETCGCLGQRGGGAKAASACPLAPEFANEGPQGLGTEDFAACHTLMFPHRNITGTWNASGNGPAFFTRPTAGQPGLTSTEPHNCIELPNTRAVGAPAAPHEMTGKKSCIRSGIVGLPPLGRSGAFRVAPFHGPMHAYVRRGQTRCGPRSRLPAFCRVPVHCVAPKQKQGGRPARGASAFPLQGLPGCPRCPPAQKDGLPMPSPPFDAAHQTKS